MVRNSKFLLVLLFFVIATLSVFATSNGAWLSKVPEKDRDRTNPYGDQPDAVAAGQRVVLPTIASVATSLGARQVSEHAFALASNHRIDCAVVSDLQAVDASLRFLDDHRMMVEPACGASLAAVYDNIRQIDGRTNIMVIVCGGITSTPEQLQIWKQNLSGG